MNIWDSVFGASKIVYKPILAYLAGAKGRGRKGKSSSPLSLSPYGLPPSTPCKEYANVPPQPGGGGLRRFGLKTGIDFLPILV